MADDLMGADGAGTTDLGEAGGAGAGGAEPTPIDLDDNALIRIKGSDKPVKFSDYSKSFQSQFTKAQQASAREKQQLQQQLSQLQAEIARARQAPQAPQQAQMATPDVFAQIESLPYLSGKDAAAVLKELVTGISEQVKQRDQVTLAALKKMQAMEQTLGSLNTSHGMNAFESKIGNWIREGGYPNDPATIAFMKSVYLALEPEPGLDDAFPDYFKEQWDAQSKMFEAQRVQAVQKARQQRNPFVPGKGGDGRPSKPLGIKADATPKQISDALWESMVKGSGDDA